MKRLLGLTLVLFLIIGMAGCGIFRKSAEDVVSDAIEAVKTVNLDEMIEYWDEEEFKQAKDDEFGKKALSALVGGMMYNIVSSEEGDDAATVNVEITNVDMSVIMPILTQEMFAYMMAAAFAPQNEQLSEDQTNQIYLDKLTELLGNPDNKTVTNTVEISLILIDGEWKIQPDGQAVDAMMGGAKSYADTVDVSG